MKTELAGRDRLSMGEAEKMANYRSSCCLISCLFPTKELKRTVFQREKEFFLTALFHPKLLLGFCSANAF